MAGFLHKFTKKPFALRIISSFNTTQPSSLAAPFVLHQTDHHESKPEYICNPNPILASIRGEKSTNAQPSCFYPSFPFGYCVSQVSPTGFDPVVSQDADDVVSGNDHSLWADSVKKKRKRKMNKHKYKKLRKRLRRKT
ncbi:uncharacterized protein LOC122076363 [Macadamia integrifolia]|uniref:uncharacterized protein LOC122076363 n=1 Tax=Macadamia integrifolia TaxID=60698 RepID=UPI001C4F9C08|nr:uncharacterized protein LOC122076363 [Macadamia integrifolia]